jgi:hypothetical protein
VEGGTPLLNTSDASVSTVIGSAVFRRSRADRLERTGTRSECAKCANLPFGSKRTREDEI